MSAPSRIERIALWTLVLGMVGVTAVLSVALWQYRAVRVQESYRMVKSAEYCTACGALRERSRTQYDGREIARTPPEVRQTGLSDYLSDGKPCAQHDWAPLEEAEYDRFGTRVLASRGNDAVESLSRDSARMFYDAETRVPELRDILRRVVLQPSRQGDLAASAVHVLAESDDPNAVSEWKTILDTCVEITERDRKRSGG